MLSTSCLEVLCRAVPQTEWTPEKKNAFSLLSDLVKETNEKINITAITEPTDVLLRHFIDSLFLLQSPEFRELVRKKASFCDIGCGGGFPGLPLAVALPGLKLTMIDSTEKKIRALAENAGKLGLSSVRPLCGRGEELAAHRTGSLREKFDGAVSRAVARLSVLSELCLPFVRPGGFFFALKGARCAEEVEEAKKAVRALSGEIVSVTPLNFPAGFSLPEALSPEDKEKCTAFSEAERYLVTIRKTKPLSSAYPRKWAQITKKPL